MSSKGKSRTVQSVDTACKVIKALKELDGAGVTELANHTGVTKGTIHCHLATLNENELVCKEDDKYRLSLRFLELGEYTKQNIDILNIVKPEIRNLADEHDARTQFVVEEHGRGVFVKHYVASSSHVPLPPKLPGITFSLHGTSSGKSILAFLPEERVDEIISMHGMDQLTENTITDKQQLYDELAEIREQGFALNDSENQHGLRAVGAPILDPNNYPLGAISISMPASRMPGEKFHSEIPEIVLNTVNVIEVNVNIRMNTQE